MRQQARGPGLSKNASRATSAAPSHANSRATSGAPSHASSRAASPASYKTNGTDEEAEPRLPPVPRPFFRSLFRSRDSSPKPEGQATAEGCTQQVVIPAASRLRCATLRDNC
eukprot:1158261-Pelagomonas_calceolata.AAC.13